MAHDVFISYSVQDKAIADGGRATLERRAIRCWIASRDILPGQDWDAGVITAIEAAKIMVLVFSSHSNDSSAVHCEVKAAFSNGLTVAPLRLDDVRLNENLEFFVGLLHWLDAMAPLIERHFIQLAESVELLLVGMPRQRDIKYGREVREQTVVLSTVCSPTTRAEIGEVNVNTPLLGVGFVDRSAQSGPRIIG
jgi:hypothetical protein